MVIATADVNRLDEIKRSAKSIAGKLGFRWIWHDMVLKEHKEEGRGGRTIPVKRVLCEDPLWMSPRSSLQLSSGLGTTPC